MSEYLLLLSTSRESPSAEQLGGQTRRLADWVGWLSHEGLLRRGGPVRTELVLPDGSRLDEPLPAAAAVAVAAQPGDARGDVGSFLLFEAGDVEAAMAIARSCPVSNTGTVRLLALDAGASFAD